MKRLILLGAALGILTSFTGCGQEGKKAKQVYATMGTGGTTGVYYPVGGAIAQLVRKSESGMKIRLTVESTGGSVYNINALMSGDLDLGIAQSDRQYQAWKGLAEWEGKPQEELRALFSLHPEVVTLVASEESGILGVQDLKDKRVNIGDPGSGNRGNALDVLAAAGVDAEKDLRTENLKASEAPTMLQDGRLDAFFYTVGHPSGAIIEATSGRRKVRIVPITGMEDLVAKSPYYAEVKIPVKLYPQAANDEDVASVGVTTTVVTSSKADDAFIYEVVKNVFTQLDELKTKHPALESLTAEGMLQGLSAPLHPAAERYYREAGLLP